MSIIFEEMSGALTEGLEELSASTGTPTVSNSIGRAGGKSYVLAEGDEIEFVGPPSTNDSGLTFGIRFSDAPSSEVEICKLGTVSVFRGTVSLNTSRQFVFRDDGTSEATIGTSGALAVDTFGLISWVAEDSATAKTRAFLDGVQIFNTTADHSANFEKTVFKNPSGSGITNMYITDYSSWSIIGGVFDDISGLVKNVEILGFSTTHAATDTDIGSAPDNNWSNIAEFPKSDSNLCTFDSVGSAKFCDQTTGDGPQGSADIDGDQHIVAVKFWHRMASGNGQGRVHARVFGHDGNTTTTTAASVTITNDPSIDSGISGTPADFFTMSSLPVEMPGSDQHAALGCGKDSTGGQDTELYEAMCMILHMPRPTPTTPTNLSDINLGVQHSFQGPYEQ